ncbi:MAG: hypothetical protein IJ306_05125 [Oscillospiraceae bacterium]|nr:hypothetical protein [Oscillospiraceae bacterium]
MKEIFLDYLEASAIAGIIILGVALLSAVIDKKFTAKWKYWVWLLIAIRLIIPFNAEFESAPAKIEVAVPDRVISAPARTEITPGEDLSTEPENDLSTDFVPAVTQPDSGAQTGLQEEQPGKEAPQITEEPAVRKEITLLDAAAVIWFLGAAVFFIWNVAVYAAFRKRTIAEGKAAGEKIKAALSKTKAELFIKNEIEVLVCKNVKSPMVMGFLAPKLVLPKEDYGETELYFILRHELTHYKRRDTLYKAVLLLANALHWFNPAVWLMQKLAGADLEVSCDALVVEGGDMETRRRYSETILASVHKEKAACGVFSTHFYGGAKTLKKRFANILSTEKRKKGIVAFVAVLVVTAVLGSTVACSADSGLPSDEEVTELIMKAQSVYQPADYTVLEAAKTGTQLYDISYEEIKNFNEVVPEIFSEKGIAELKSVQIPEIGENVFVENAEKYYRLLSVTDEDIIYYNAVLSVELIEQNENSFIYEIMHKSLDKFGNSKEYTSYITIAEQDGKYLVESFDSKRYALPGKEATGGSAFYSIEYSEPEIIADHIAALNQLSWGNYGAEFEEHKYGTFLFKEYPDEITDIPDAVTFENLSYGSEEKPTFEGYYIDPFERTVQEVTNYSLKAHIYKYLREYFSEDIVYAEQENIDRYFVEFDGKLYKGLGNIGNIGITYGNSEIISQTDRTITASAHVYVEYSQQEIGTVVIDFEKKAGNKWVITSVSEISEPAVEGLSYEENGLLGLIGKNGEKLTEAKYNKIFEEEFFGEIPVYRCAVKDGFRWDLKFDYTNYGEPEITNVENLEFYLVDENGKELLPEPYHTFFYYLNENGNDVIEGYKYGSRYVYERQSDGSFELIETDYGGDTGRIISGMNEIHYHWGGGLIGYGLEYYGENILEPIYDDIQCYFADRIIVREGMTINSPDEARTKIIDTEGNIISAEYNYIFYGFLDDGRYVGMAICTELPVSYWPDENGNPPESGRWFVDKDGNKISERFMYNGVSYLSGTYSADTEITLVDENGEEISVKLSDYALTPNNGTMLTQSEIDRVSKEFNNHIATGGVTYANAAGRFFSSEYTKPEELDPVNFLLYFPSGSTIKDEAEFEDLKKVWASYGQNVQEGTTIDDYPVPLHKIPRSEVNEVFEKYMGITIENLEKFDLDYLAEHHIYYMEKYDCFYTTTSDADFSYFRCVSGEKLSDGTVILYNDNQKVLTLKKQPDGSYFIYSYQSLG